MTKYVNEVDQAIRKRPLVRHSSGRACRNAQRHDRSERRARSWTRSHEAAPWSSLRLVSRQTPRLALSRIRIANMRPSSLGGLIALVRTEMPSAGLGHTDDGLTSGQAVREKNEPGSSGPCLAFSSSHSSCVSAVSAFRSSSIGVFVIAAVSMPTGSSFITAP